VFFPEKNKMNDLDTYFELFGNLGSGNFFVNSQKNF
jgi:hypothetical protein